MLQLNGSFHGFLDALFGFLSVFLSDLFGWLANLLDGLQIQFG